MQTFRYITHQVPLRTRVCLGWPLSSAATSRTFFTSPVQNKSSEHHELPKDSALSTKPNLEQNPKPSDDPELRKWRRLALASMYKRNRYTTDKDYRDRVLEKARKDYDLRMNTDPHYAITSTLRYWVYQLPAAREQLSWKTHIPILTSEKVERRCASCHVKRQGGMKLFWQRRQEPEDDKHLFDCNTCFFKHPAVCLPTGFEDVKTVEQLRIRGEQVLGVRIRQFRRKTASPPPSTG